jgi:hypothetical protein
MYLILIAMVGYTTFLRRPLALNYRMTVRDDLEQSAGDTRKMNYTAAYSYAGRSGGPASFDAATFVRRNMVERGVKPLKRWRGPPRGTKSA